MALMGCLGGQLLILTTMSVVALPAVAETAADRDIRLAPYVFLASVDGEASIGDVAAPVSLQAPDLFGDTNAGIMGYGQYGVGDVFAYGEGIAMDYHDTRFEQLFNADVESSVFFLELGMGRTWRSDILGEMGAFSLYGGARYVTIDTHVTLGMQSIDGDAEWLDPVIGAIVEQPLGARWSVLAKVDMAGFGMGGSRYASAAMMLERRISAHVDIVAGWRIATQDFESDHDTLALDLEASGPQLGLAWRY